MLDRSKYRNIASEQKSGGTNSHNENLPNIHTSKQAGPDILTTAMALFPGGVESAKIVVSSPEVTIDLRTLWSGDVVALSSTLWIWDLPL